MNQELVLNQLIKLRVSLDEIKEKLAQLPWDCEEPIVMMHRDDLIEVFSRIKKKELDISTLVEWADLIEGREDIGFEIGFDDLMSETISRIANSDINGEIAEIEIDRLIDRLCVG